jgi:L-asparagine oxygenase
VTLTQKIILYRYQLEKLLKPEQKDCLKELAVGRGAYCFITGLPVPADADLEELATQRAFGVLGVMYLRPVSYRNEYNGEIVHDISPKPGKDAEASSSGRAALPMHSDMAFLRFPGEHRHPFKAAGPDFLILSGVVNEPHIETRLVQIDDALQDLSDDEVKTLNSGFFDIASPATVKPRRLAENVPLLFDSPYGQMLRYNGATDKVVGRTPEAISALEKLGKVLTDDKHAKDIDIQGGTVLVFNNRKVVHGRAAIPANQSTDGARHFKRIYGQRIETDTNPVYPTNPFIQAL